MNVRLITVAYHLGHERVGMGLGPARFLEAGVDRQLADRGHAVRVHEVRRDGPASHEIGAVFDLNRLLASAVRDAVDAGEFPLVLAGNCNSSLGILAGLGAPGIGIVWFDAHGDLNTPETSPTGFFDGMSLALATGRCWRALSATVPGFVPVDERRVVLVAARDLDPGERILLDGSPIRRVAPGPGARGTFRSSLEDTLEELRKEAGEIYLHLDLDALDPGEAPVNAFAAPGGLGVAEMEDAIRAVRGRFAIRAAALTAYDPAGDEEGRALRAGLRLAQAVVGGGP